MANKLYPNHVLAFEIENQLFSNLNLNRFVTVDNSLVGVAGDKVKVVTYTATEGAEKLAMGAGNTKIIESNHTEKEYQILLAQNRTRWYDEEKMIDPRMVQVLVRRVGTDLYNFIQKDIFAEFGKATTTINTGAANKWTFEAFVDAMAALSTEEQKPEELNTFAFVTPKIVAQLRKDLKDTLQYNESFVRSGFVGVVGGVPLYITKHALTAEGEEPTDVIVATKKAVTLFVKTGVQVERDRVANTRENWLYSRKYYVPALTDQTQVVKLKAAV